MLQKTLMALALAGCVVAAGCGGGGSSGGGGSGSTEDRNTVSGPLDAVQEPISMTVIAPLADAVAGTPLEGVLQCVDQVVVGDVLDAVDALASSVDPTAVANPVMLAANLQAEVTNLVADLQGLIFSLAGTSGCSADAVPQPGNGLNPLDGTTLAALGALLPQLAGLQGQLGAGALSLTELTTIVDQLTSLFSGALPVGVGGDLPIAGPALELVGSSLENLLAALTAGVGGDPTTIIAAITSTVQGILDGVLTDLVPLNLIEGTSGDPGAVTGDIQSLITQLTGVLGGAGGLGDVGNIGLENLLSGEVGNLLDPFNLLLTPVLGAITNLGGIPGVGSPTSTPLDGVLTALTGLLGTSGTNPLSDILGTVLGGVGGGSGSCALEGTPLEGLCGILGGLGV